MFSAWYAKNYYWINTIDTMLFILLLLSLIYDGFILKRFNRYNEPNIIAIIVLLAVLLLQSGYWLFDLNYTDYIIIYKSIIVGGLIGLVLSFVSK